MLVVGGLHNEVEVIDFGTNGLRSCIGHQDSDHMLEDAVGLMVGDMPTICGGGYTEIVADCRSLDLETGSWSDGLPLINARFRSSKNPIQIVMDLWP